MSWRATGNNSRSKCLETLKWKQEFVVQQPRMPNSNFIFGCILGYRILKQSDNLRYEFKVFQYLVVRVKVFWKISSEHFQKTFNLTIYNLFWDFMLLHRKIGENNQQLKRVGKLSDWLKSSKKMYYCWKIYFATISHVVNSIHERFVQPDFKKYIQL